MIGGLNKTTSLLALTAAATVLATSAMAADLGGNCCADLEERIAELEATTARKGNRVVSLTVSGQINKMLVYHDSDEADAWRRDQISIRDNDAGMSRFRFNGEAKIDSEWKAGYLMEIGVYEDFGTSTLTQNGTGNNSAAFLIRHNMLYVESSRLGRVWLGQTSTATDGAFEVTLANTFVTPAGSDEHAQILGAAYSIFDTPIDGARRQSIGWRSPTIQGFVLTSAWGHNTQSVGATDAVEFWDIALRYANEFNGIRVASAIGFRQENGVGANSDVDTFMTSSSIMHVPTGLFVSSGYGHRDADVNTTDQDVYWVMAGLERKFIALGATTFYGEYGSIDFDLNTQNDGTYWGGGITQKVDAAAMDLYLNIRNYELDRPTGQLDTDATAVTAGARIRF